MKALGFYPYRWTIPDLLDAPGGDADEMCAKAGIAATCDELDC